jgi:rare lipoprotein A
VRHSYLLNSTGQGHSLSSRLAVVSILCLLPLFLTGCGEKKQARVNVPPPPSIQPAQPAETPGEVSSNRTRSAPRTTEPQSEAAKPADEENTDEGSTAEEQDMPSLSSETKPILVETGLASWYGAPYHNRRGSNGEIYDMNAMTAAHRTLPLGSIVRVINVKTGHAATVRITDRGPFIKGRIVDLSLAAAKKVDLWQPGIAMVRVEVLHSAAPLDRGGRWGVQIGAFHEEDTAKELVSQLSRRYHSAKVGSFSSPVGDWWIRVKVKNDDRKRAEEVAHDSQTPQGSIFLVRLD